MNHSTKPPTPAEKVRMDALSAMPCVACEQIMMPQPLRTEIHHLVDRGYRKHSGGHMSTIPLCSWHHAGTVLYPQTSREMLMLYGPSLARSKRAFVAQFGSERTLLAVIDARLSKRDAA